MTEHQTPGWRLLQQLHGDEPSQEQDVIAASKEVTLPAAAASPTRGEGSSHSPLGDSRQPRLMGLWSPGTSLVQPSASQNHPQVLRGGHQGFGKRPRGWLWASSTNQAACGSAFTRLRKAKSHKALWMLLIHSNLVLARQSPVPVPQSPNQSSLLRPALTPTQLQAVPHLLQSPLSPLPRQRQKQHRGWPQTLFSC